MNNTEDTRKELLPFEATYKTTRVYPAKPPSVTIFFHGLLCFCFDGSKVCEVGVNTESPLHRLEVEAWKKVPDPDPTKPHGCEIVGIGLEAGFRSLDINVWHPDSDASGVCVYEGSSSRSIPRHSYVEYCLDLEKYYDKPLIKEPGALQPRLYINHGIFSAYRVSKSRFALYNDDGTVAHGLENVAFVLAADIFLEPDKGYVEFVVDGKTTLDTVLTHGSEYEIAITNSCASAAGCHFDPDSSKPEERNDFYVYYKAINLRPDEKPFELVNIESAGSPTPSGMGHCCMSRHTFSDPAPCLPIGFGRSSNIG